MLYEYAVEPELLNTWERFRYFFEKFGVSQGRFIARYPRTWKRMVYQSLAGCSDMDRKRIEVRLEQINDRLLRRQGLYDASRGWLENAETEHASAPFPGDNRGGQSAELPLRARRKHTGRPAALGEQSAGREWSARLRTWQTRSGRYWNGVRRLFLLIPISDPRNRDIGNRLRHSWQFWAAAQASARSNVSNTIPVIELPKPSSNTNAEKLLSGLTLQVFKFGLYVGVIRDFMTASSSAMWEDCSSGKDWTKMTALVPLTAQFRATERTQSGGQLVRLRNQSHVVFRG